MSSALDIINEAVDPKRFIMQRRPDDLMGWLKKNFAQSSPDLFFQKIDLPELNLNGTLWANAYPRNVWYHMVLLYGQTRGSPVFGTWQVEPVHYLGEPDQATEYELVKKLDKLNRAVQKILAARPPGNSLHGKRRWLREQLDAAFNEANYGLPHRQ